MRAIQLSSVTRKGALLNSFILFLILSAGSAFAVPTWMGVYNEYQRHNGENPGLFQILMNQDYSGLHCEVGMSIDGGTWNVYPMTWAGNPDGNSLWEYTPTSSFPAGSSVEFYFHGYDDWSGNIYDSDGGNNYTITFGGIEMTVDGINADYTTTKYYIDEINGEYHDIVVTFTIPEGVNADQVEIFSNLNRRDLCDVDYSSALITADGYPDGIKPPDGNLVTSNDTGAYYTAFPMHHVSGSDYIWTGRVDKCGAYRITGRYHVSGEPATTWNWYTSNGRRDHAVVVAPKKALDLTMYELNTLTVEATDQNEAGRSTFRDLLSTSDYAGDDDAYDYFNLEYLNFIQANCLWFQPIHPTAGVRDQGYSPGSPYSTKNYFAVNRYMGADGTEQGAFDEFTNFVAHCDAYDGTVGTINIMLDGVFNHSSWDAVMGQGGVDLGMAASVGTPIYSAHINWYSRDNAYDQPATYYNTAWDNDIAVAPDRYDFGKWDDVADLFFGNYSALVSYSNAAETVKWNHNNEDDVFDFAGMQTYTMDLWKYFAYYPEYWIKKTGHSGTNSWVREQDDKGIDGLRCDFGQGLPPPCWEYIINHTRKTKWNFVFMAETLDGGNPGYRSNRHFDILNENLVFRFTQDHLNDSPAIRSAIEDRRTWYRSGLILLNLTSHDEVLPDDDPWVVASRYGAVSTVDGSPMIFYGQEQGIKNYQTDPSYWNWDGFKTDHELNFGKYIPNFKQWNQLVVWENPPPDNSGLAQWYGRVNWARLNSPALQSHNRYFIKNTSGNDNNRIFAVAKYEEPGVGPADTDIVLAFALLLRHGESPHVGAADTYDVTGWENGLVPLLALDPTHEYNVLNLASSDALGTYLWPANRTGQDINENGVYVSFNPGTVQDDGALVQYLRLVDMTEFGSQPLLALTDNGNSYSVSFTTEANKKYVIEYADVLTADPAWYTFNNSSAGEHISSGSPGSHTFTDDFSIDTSGARPTGGFRCYRVKVEDL